MRFARRLTTIGGVTAVAIAFAVVAVVAARDSRLMASPQARGGQAPTRDAGAPAPQASGSIAGTLVSLDTGRAIRRAQVTITGGDGQRAKTVATDDAGAFAFTQLPAGAYSLAATKSGYLDVTYGQHRPGSGASGTAIPLAESQHIANLKFAMPRGGVVTGLVTDEQGEPAYNVPVRALRYTMRSGERALVSASSTSTDDRGIYRLPLLPPGEYVISASPRDDQDTRLADLRFNVEAMAVSYARGAASDAEMAQTKQMMAQPPTPDTQPTSGYAPVYYPGTTALASATSVMIEVGQERAGVDLQLQLVPMTRVTGTVTGGEPRSNVLLTLVDATQPLVSTGARTARAGADGRFMFSSVTPGAYVVLARTQGTTQVMSTGPNGQILSVKMNAESTPQMWGSADVSVDGANPADVAITLQHGMTVSGDFKFDATSSDTDFSRVRVSLAPASNAGMDLASTATGTADANGHFVVSNVAPGKYRLSVGGLNARWAPKSAMFGGRDVFDLALEVKAGEDLGGGLVTFTTRLGELSGTLQDANGHPTSDYTIVLFPADTRYWTPMSRRIQATRPSTDGAFHLRSLPSGDYRLIAVTDVEPGQWFDPAFLQQLSGQALPIALTDGERKVQDLRVR